MDCVSPDRRIGAVRLYAMIQELETFELRNPILGILAKPYIRLRLGELRTMLSRNPAALDVESSLPPKHGPNKKVSDQHQPEAEGSANK